MESFFAQLKDKWFIIVFIAGMILWYGDTNNRLNAVEAKQEDIAPVVQDINQLKVDVAVVKNDVVTVKTDVATIKNILLGN